MRVFILGFLLTCVAAGGAFAQSIEDATSTCRDNGAEYQTRVAACDTLIESGEMANNPWPHAWRGDAHEDAENYAAALEDYNIALGIDPEHTYALSGRVVSFWNLDRFQEAAGDTETLMRVEPNDDWNFLVHGRLMLRLDRAEEAIEPFAIARELDPDEEDGYFYAAVAYLDMGEPLQAEFVLQQYLQSHPFNTRVHFKLGEVYDAMQDTARAGLHYRVVNILSPNNGVAKMRADEYGAVVEGIDLPPAEYVAPAPFHIQYLVDVLPVDTTDDMEDAILELQFFFTGTNYPVPIASAVIDYDYESEGDNLSYVGSITADNGFEDFLGERKFGSHAQFYRGMLQNMFLPDDENAPIREVVFHAPGPAALWPLNQGNTVSGTGDMRIECPNPPTFRTSFLGCVDDAEFVNVADVTYSISVDGEQQIHVPMGTFDTFIVNYTTTYVISAMGQSSERTRTERFWFAPEIGFWVKRRTYIDDHPITFSAIRMDIE